MRNEATRFVGRAFSRDSKKVDRESPPLPQPHPRNPSLQREEIGFIGRGFSRDINRTDGENLPLAQLHPRKAVVTIPMSHREAVRPLAPSYPRDPPQSLRKTKTIQPVALRPPPLALPHPRKKLEPCD
jgi:hypothetical protein